MNPNLDQKEIIDKFQKSCTIILENIPRKYDSVEEKRNKLSKYENIVSENIKQEKSNWVGNEIMRDYYN